MCHEWDRADVYAGRHFVTRHANKIKLNKNSKNNSNTICRKNSTFIDSKSIALICQNSVTAIISLPSVLVFIPSGAYFVVYLILLKECHILRTLLRFSPYFDQKVTLQGVLWPVLWLKIWQVSNGGQYKCRLTAVSMLLGFSIRCSPRVSAK